MAERLAGDGDVSVGESSATAFMQTVQQKEMKR
jgi:hypothetical protein